MSLVIFNNGWKPKGIASTEQSNKIWRVLNGEVEPESDKQAAFVAAIERIYLNREHAPESYLRMYPEVYVPDSYAGTLGKRK